VAGVVGIGKGDFLGAEVSRELRVEGLVVWGALCKINAKVEPDFT
jgi:hypothetical protein